MLGSLVMPIYQWALHMWHIQCHLQSYLVNFSIGFIWKPHLALKELEKARNHFSKDLKIMWLPLCIIAPVQMMLITTWSSRSWKSRKKLFKISLIIYMSNPWQKLWFCWNCIRIIKYSSWGQGGIAKWIHFPCLV